MERQALEGLLIIKKPGNRGEYLDRIFSIEHHPELCHHPLAAMGCATVMDRVELDKQFKFAR